MHQDILNEIDANSDWISRQRLNRLGVTDKQIRRLVDQGHLRRLRHGTYASEQRYRNASPTDKHRILTTAALAKLGSGYVATHQSAAVLLGLDVYGLELENVHVARLDGRTGRREAGIVYHEFRQQLQEKDIDESGLPCTTAAHASLVTAASNSIEAGVCMGSSALRKGLAMPKDFASLCDRLEGSHGADRVRATTFLSDARLESMGEARSMVLFWKHQLVLPSLQHPVYDRSGALIGRADFAWLEHGHLGEFDGATKYGLDHADPREALMAEKKREDRMRAMGFSMSRWTWSDLDPVHSHQTVSMISHCLAARPNSA